ncbi:hypothetical protein JTE90_016391 [Oedothorax gibbosus]|uniref:Uncharacterized protein n=1 Tax=Oedothorax gibbosus TaxID=931172 RepID=A0AAV6TIF2_9ARAC|nr:hypothetical protein JTE90_016391 [Oedothorax gibbosus]
MSGDHKILETTRKTFVPPRTPAFLEPPCGKRGKNLRRPRWKATFPWERILGRKNFFFSAGGTVFETGPDPVPQNLHGGTKKTPGKCCLRSKGCGETRSENDILLAGCEKDPKPRNFEVVRKGIWGKGFKKSGRNKREFFGRGFFQRVCGEKELPKSGGEESVKKFLWKGFPPKIRKKRAKEIDWGKRGEVKTWGETIRHHPAEETI